MALVFPFVILTMTMSGGAMGGGVASAIARALGAGDRERASMLASHALLIGLCFGLTFMLGMLIFGPGLLELLGGRGNVLAQAVGYTQIFFGGAVLPWSMNTMAGVLRGTGNMKLPSLLMLSSATCQIILGGTLGLGLGPIPSFGMRGVAAGSLTAYLISVGVMGWYLFSGRARVVPKIRGLRIQWPMFFDILKVGAVSCFSPLQSVLTISIFTHMLAGFGTAILAGYGIGARLEFLLTSVSFAFGIASVPMIGMAVGARRIARARRIAWTAAAIAFVAVGAIATFIAIFPDVWVSIFTGDAGVRAASRQYLATAAPMYAFIGLRIVDVFLLAGRGQGGRAGAGAKRAAGLHWRRRLVAVDAPCHGGELFLVGGGFDGAARRAVVPERHPDALGTEGLARAPTFVRPSPWSTNAASPRPAAWRARPDPSARRCGARWRWTGRRRSRSGG